MDLDNHLGSKGSLTHSRPRQMRIGDLLFAVAMVAIGLSAITTPELTGRQMLFLSLFALAFLTLIGAQWALPSIPRTLLRPGMSSLMAVVAALLAMAMFTCLMFVGLFFPRTAALLSVMALLQVLYLTTWD